MLNFVSCNNLFPIGYCLHHQMTHFVSFYGSTNLNIVGLFNCLIIVIRIHVIQIFLQLFFLEIFNFFKICVIRFDVFQRTYSTDHFAYCGLCRLIELILQIFNIGYIVSINTIYSLKNIFKI